MALASSRIRIWIESWNDITNECDKYPNTSEKLKYLMKQRLDFGKHVQTTTFSDTVMLRQYRTHMIEWDKYNSFRERNHYHLKAMNAVIKKLDDYISQLRDIRGMFLVLRRLIPEDVKTYIVATSHKA